MSKLTQEEMDKISTYFANQKGREYPYSNQIVRCVIITPDREKGSSLIEEYFLKNNIQVISKRISKEKIMWTTNEEQWVWFFPGEFFTGYRFYKLWIDKEIEGEIIKEIFLPCCANYCTEVKFI